MKKQLLRLLSMLLTLLLVCCALPLSAAALTDTPPDGYTAIYTPEDLDAIRNDLAGKYILMNDIDLADWGSWMPIGSGTEGEYDNGKFTGIIDGNGYEIQNMTVSGAMMMAFVSWLEGTIKNLGIVNAYVEPPENGGFISAILAAGIFTGIIENCYTQGVVRSVSDFYRINVGGLVGQVGGDPSEGLPAPIIRNCYSVGSFSYEYTGEPTEQGEFYANGIAMGVYGGVVENCFSNVEPIDTIEEEISLVTNVSLLTEAQMKQQANFVGFDFDTPVWFIQEGKSYPKLRPFPVESPTHFPDEETGITVDAGEGVFKPATEMQVTELDGGNFVLGPGKSVHAVYDIQFINDNKIVQPDGTVTVRLPLKDVSPSTSANWKVYHVERDDKGNITGRTDMNARVVEISGVWYWEFDTDHFSIYAVVEEAAVAAVDKTALQTAITAAEAQLNSQEYHADVKQALEKALADAKTKLNDGTATQAQVDSATNALNNAAKELSGKSFFKLWGKPTKWEKTPWNWVMCIVLFGWIWMVF